jgi:transcriptional regulator with XRE-family HTH domain
MFLLENTHRLMRKITIMKMQQIVGNNIKAFRLQRKLTQKQLAVKAKSHKAYIGFIERGEKNMTIETLCSIADALEVSPFVFLLPEAKQWVK